MRPSNHGMHSFKGKSELCDITLYQQESFGRFGRLFRSLSPLYLNPNVLRKIGAQNGPMDNGAAPKLTDNVPLGMIFFGQFIDHDITFDTTSNFSRINDPSSIENTRSAQLDLDCVFGGGPEDEPFLFDNPNTRGLYLLTGKTNNNIGQGQAIEVHDLPRTGTGTAIIGDPRNDENRVLSQLQLAFIRFYNHTYDHLNTENQNIADDNLKKSPKELYEEARELVTWHYQWIVVNEFLPLLCGERIVSNILGKGRAFYKPCDNAFIPVEFSVAAYRFGHSMIAQSVKLQSDGDTHSIFSPQFGQGFAKISNLSQVIEWSTFFDFDGTYQRAEQLDTQMASILLDLPFIPSPDPGDRSLATRNLRRGQSFLLPSGESVAKCIIRPEEEIEIVKNHIAAISEGMDIDLNSGAPLWLYILAEAEVIGRLSHNGVTVEGEGLGPVGGTIVAEVILGLLELDPHSYLGSNRDWSPTLGDQVGQFTMKDLLTIADQAQDL